jgi:hypothetical protein
LLEIFDEWAAVLRHKDEMAKIDEMKEKEAQKERQRKYWEALEEQRKELKTKALQSNEENRFREQEALKQQIDFGKNNAELAQAKEQEKKVKAMELMLENFREKQKAKEDIKEQEKNENKAIQEHLRNLQDREMERVEQEKNAKLRLASALKQSYTVQEQLKMQEKYKEKELDKLFTAKQEEVAVTVEKDRQRVFKDKIN